MEVNITIYGHHTFASESGDDPHKRDRKLNIHLRQDGNYVIITLDKEQSGFAVSVADLKKAVDFFVCKD